MALLLLRCVVCSARGRGLVVVAPVTVIWHPGQGCVKVAWSVGEGSCLPGRVGRGKIDGKEIVTLITELQKTYLCVVLGTNCLMTFSGEPFAKLNG
ncbi:hypothetical protein BDY21DRAFT_338741 [Lineolata rhizophorae]|uniref:Secreted protein n=1 Tax=Lineolata rhizophorae TaxID=578093 RepID=A0A6A6P729_9PEZI|nr:hypothetical protein BDY21DRAFT_338741 [Lineolata rhizophorae]